MARCRSHLPPLFALLACLAMLLAGATAWAADGEMIRLSVQAVVSVAALGLSAGGIAYSAGVLGARVAEHSRRLSRLDGPDGVLDRLARVETRLDGMGEVLDRIDRALTGDRP